MLSSSKIVLNIFLKSKHLLFFLDSSGFSSKATFTKKRPRKGVLLYNGNIYGAIEVC